MLDAVVCVAVDPMILAKCIYVHIIILCMLIYIVGKILHESNICTGVITFKKVANI